MMLYSLSIIVTVLYAIMISITPVLIIQGITKWVIGITPLIVITRNT